MVVVSKKCRLWLNILNMISRFSHQFRFILHSWLLSLNWSLQFCFLLNLIFSQLSLGTRLVFHLKCPQRQANLNIVSLMRLILKRNLYTSTKRILIDVVGTSSPLQRSYMAVVLFQGGTESLKCSKTNQDTI